MTRATIGMLPAEIIDDILGYLHVYRWRRYDTGNPTLRACTLVCKDWRMLAQTHLFRKVYYSFTEDNDDNGVVERTTVENRGDSWKPYYERDNYRPSRTLAMLHGFLASSPGIASSIQRLMLDGYAPANPTQDPGEHLSSLYKLYYDLLRHVPQLQELCMRNVSVFPPQPTSFTPPPNPPSLRRLRLIYDSNARHATDLSCIIGCFGSIDNLHLSYISPEPMTASSTLGTHVTNAFVDAHEDGIPAVVEGLLQCLRHDAVRALVVSGTDTSMQLYQPLIDQLAPNLEELTYEFPRQAPTGTSPPHSSCEAHRTHAHADDDVQPQWHTRVRRTPFPKLRALRFALPLYLARASTLADLLGAVGSYVSGAGVTRDTHPALAELGLNVRVVMEGGASVGPAARRRCAQDLDRALVERAHALALPTVAVRWLVGEERRMKNAETWVRDMFPALQENGMLDFCGVVRAYHLAQLG